MCCKADPKSTTPRGTISSAPLNRYAWQMNYIVGWNGRLKPLSALDDIPHGSERSQLARHPQVNVTTSHLQRPRNRDLRQPWLNQLASVPTRARRRLHHHRCLVDPCGLLMLLPPSIGVPGHRIRFGAPSVVTAASRTPLYGAIAGLLGPVS